MQKLMTLLICLAVAGCGMDDSDRCLDGYEYDPQGRECRLIETEEVCGEGPGVPEGFATACTEQSTCDPYDLVCQNENPMKPEGYCTYQECAPEGCPPCYQCCDCPDTGGVTICLADDDADLAVQFAGCTCS